MHMTSIGKEFNKVSDYVKKFKGVTQECQDKMLANKSYSIGNFSRSYSKGHGQQAYSFRLI